MVGGHPRRHEVGDALEHEGEASRPDERLRVEFELAGRLGVLALDDEPAQRVDRLRREPEVPHHWDFGIEDRANGWDPAPSSLELHGLRAGPHEGGRVPHGVRGVDVVAHPGHVADDEGARLRGATAPTWWTIWPRSTPREFS